MPGGKKKVMSNFFGGEGGKVYYWRCAKSEFTILHDFNNAHNASCVPPLSENNSHPKQTLKTIVRGEIGKNGCAIFLVVGRSKQDVFMELYISFGTLRQRPGMTCLKNLDH